MRTWVHARSRKRLRRRPPAGSTLCEDGRCRRQLHRHRSLSTHPQYYVGHTPVWRLRASGARLGDREAADGIAAAKTVRRRLREYYTTLYCMPRVAVLKCCDIDDTYHTCICSQTSSGVRGIQRCVVLAVQTLHFKLLHAVTPGRPVLVLHDCTAFSGACSECKAGGHLAALRWGAGSLSPPQRTRAVERAA